MPPADRDGAGGQAVVDALAEIATSAAFAAMGNVSPQLNVHIQAGLNVGLRQREITEILIQMAVNANFPAALNALFAAKEVFATESE